MIRILALVLLLATPSHAGQWRTFTAENPGGYGPAKRWKYYMPTPRGCEPYCYLERLERRRCRVVRSPQHRT